MARLTFAVGNVQDAVGAVDSHRGRIPAGGDRAQRGQVAPADTKDRNRVRRTARDVEPVTVERQCVRRRADSIGARKGNLHARHDLVRTDVDDGDVVVVAVRDEEVTLVRRECVGVQTDRDPRDADR